MNLFHRKAEMPPASLIVAAFISAGSGNSGQGDHLLLHRPREAGFGQHDLSKRKGLTFIILEVQSPHDRHVTLAPPLTALQVAERGIERSTHLVAQEDLVLVRSSKPLRWNGDALLISFLFRVRPERELAQGDERVHFGARLGEHSWLPIEGLLKSPAVDSPLVATALLSCVLPPAFDRAMVQILQAPCGALEVVQLSCAALWAGIQSSLSHASLPPSALRVFHPDSIKQAALPNGSSPAAVRERNKRLKLALRRYWVEVLAWQLKALRPETTSASSYAFIRLFDAVTPAMDDSSAGLLQLRDLALRALTQELERIDAAGALQTAYALEAVKQAATTSVANDKEVRVADTLHIFTLSASSAVLSTLRGLIHQVLAPRSTLGQQARTLPSLLKITVAEGRPAFEGARLAATLADTVRSASTRLSDLKLRPPPQIHELAGEGKGSGLHALLDAMRDWKRRSIEKHVGSAAVVGATPSVAQGRVAIEVVTDAALVSAITSVSTSSKQRGLLLLGAKHVAENGTAQVKVGGKAAAWAAQQAGFPVIVLALVEKVGGPDGNDLQRSPAEVTDVYRCVGGEALESVALSAADPADGLLTVSNLYFEGVDVAHISTFVTEAGSATVETVKKLAGSRNAAEKRVWG